MASYSVELKEGMVSRMCSPGGPSAYQLAKETGISHASLLSWRQAFSGESVSKKDRRPEDWSAAEKLQAILDCQNLSEESFGSYLREQGLHSSHIDTWKSELFAEAKKKNRVGRPKLDPELVKAREELKKVKRDLDRKNKALAEQTALVILQKKVDAYWVDKENEESF